MPVTVINKVRDHQGCGRDDADDNPAPARRKRFVRIEVRVFDRFVVINNVLAHTFMFGIAGNARVKHNAFFAHVPRAGFWCIKLRLSQTTTSPGDHLC